MNYYTIETFILIEGKVPKLKSPEKYFSKILKIRKGISISHCKIKSDTYVNKKFTGSEIIVLGFFPPTSSFDYLFNTVVEKVIRPSVKTTSLFQNVITPLYGGVIGKRKDRC